VPAAYTVTPQSDCHWNERKVKIEIGSRSSRWQPFVFRNRK